MQPQAARQSRPGIRLPCPLEPGAESYTVIPEKVLAQRFHAHLKVIEVVIVGKEAFAGIRGVLLCQRVNALPCSQIVIAGAGLGCPPVKQRPVDKQHLRGFGKGQNRLPPADHPLLTKGGDKRRQLLLTEIVPIVHQNLLIRQRQHRLGIGHKDIRQRRRAGVAVGGGQHALVDGVGVADQLHLHPDVLLRTHGAVELLHQGVEGGIHLTAVYMPQGYGHRFSGFIAAPGKAHHQQQSHCQRRQTRLQLVHRKPSDHMQKQCLFCCSAPMCRRAAGV